VTRGAPERRQAEAAGRRAEFIAAMVMRLKGFSIIERRYRAAGGEIDLIARRGGLIAFVEVKTRRRLDDAVFAVTPANRRRIASAAASFFARRPALAESAIRYDIVAIAGWRIRHLADAWRDGD